MTLRLNRSYRPLDFLRTAPQGSANKFIVVLNSAGVETDDEISSEFDADADVPRSLITVSVVPTAGVRAVNFRQVTHVRFRDVVYKFLGREFDGVSFILTLQGND